MKAIFIHKRLKSLANSKDAEILRWFFKTGPGEYGEGDVFIGIRVPAIRRLVKEFQAVDEQTVLNLLASPVHEARLLALLILVRQFEGERRRYAPGFITPTWHIPTASITGIWSICRLRRLSVGIYWNVRVARCLPSRNQSPYGNGV